MTISIYFGLWLLFGGLMVLVGRILRSAPPTVRDDVDVVPKGMEDATMGNVAGLAGVTLILSLPLLAATVVADTGASVAPVVGLPLLVLLVALLHLRRRTSSCEHDAP
ncbi:MAG: hypothetical protein O2782_04045 [bacterium]|nr:hypothetical protein [bacterium]